MTQSKETLEKAGFNKVKKRAPTKITVTTHPLFPHHIFKIYLDTQPAVDDSTQWIKRIKGAHAVRECIKKYGCKHLYVPQKWIYPLPLEPSPPQDSGHCRKNFILVTEKIALVSYQENRKAFKTKMTPEILNELYIVLKELNLIGSVYLKNIPFTKEGKIALINTEYYHTEKEVHYHRLTRHLSDEMQIYWNSLIKEG